MTQRWIERRNNERKKKVDFFSVWSFKTQLILIEKFAKESHYRQQYYKSDFSGTWVQMFFWRPYLSKVLVSITVIKSFFFCKKDTQSSCVSTFFCMCILVCTCLYTYISVCGYLHMLTHVQLYAHTVTRGYHQVPSSFALCLLFIETDSFEKLILQDELVSKLQESSHPLPLHSHNYRQGPS